MVEPLPIFKAGYFNSFIKNVKKHELERKSIQQRYEEENFDQESEIPSKNKNLFEEKCFFVEVFHLGMDASECMCLPIIANKGTIHHKICSSTSYVVFNEGRDFILGNALQLDIPLVTPLFIEDCLKQKVLLNHTNYLINKNYTELLINRHLKSKPLELQGCEALSKKFPSKHLNLKTLKRSRKTIASTSQSLNSAINLVQNGHSVSSPIKQIESCFSRSRRTTAERSTSVKPCENKVSIKKSMIHKFGESENTVLRYSKSESKTCQHISEITISCFKFLNLSKTEASKIKGLSKLIKAFIEEVDIARCDCLVVSDILLKDVIKGSHSFENFDILCAAYLSKPIVNFTHFGLYAKGLISHLKSKLPELNCITSFLSSKHK